VTLFVHDASNLGANEMPSHLFRVRINSSLCVFGVCDRSMRQCRCCYRPLSFSPLRPLTWTNHPVLRFFTMGNQQSTVAYEPTKFATSTTPSTAKPVKSAMRRSSSVSEDASGLGQGSTSRYLPKGLSAGHSGLVIPTRPGDVASTGYQSPEWGW
jgi:hypothetical protein